MAEKTEPPTPKKLRDARKKGQVAQSKEVVSATLICSVFIYLWVMSDYYVSEVTQLIILPTTLAHLPFDQALKLVLDGMLWGMVKLVGPFILMVFALGILANVAQVGVLFTGTPIKPEFKKINPVEGAKKIISKKSLFELLKSIIKISVLATLIYLLLVDSLSDFTKVPLCGLQCLPSLIANIFKWLFIYSGIAFLTLAIIDFTWQKSQHIKQLKMSKDEVIREHKEMEGDPQIKGKRKQLHQELLNSDIKPKVKQSTAVVVNPTHVAVGIYYEQGKVDLPVITIMGTDEVAKRIKAIARDENIPMMENVPLARALLASSEVGAYIPSDLIEPVAEVLKWVKSIS